VWGFSISDYDLSMAKVIVEDSRLVLKLNWLEKIGALHGNLVVDKSKLVSKKFYAKPWSAEVLKGVRAPGTGFPYLILLGTMRYKGGKDFTAIYKKRAVNVYEFKDYSFKRWIVTE
jgi:hypothetical protein